MAEYNSFGMSPVRRRTPIGMNVTAFADAVSKLDAKYQDMAKQQSAIDMAIGQLPVNAAEDVWRYRLADEIHNQINAVDNPNDKYLTSIRAAGELISRPDVIGRIRAEAEYKNFVEQTQKRNDLTEDDKAWALANNPYSYQDTRDASGRIVGGTMWKAGRTPVGMVDYNTILAKARQLVFQEAGGSTDVVFHDAEGKPITNPTDITKVAGVMYTKNGQWQGIDKNKLNDIIEASIDNTPGARARLDQDWEVANWKYNQMTPEEKEINKPSELFASNGKKYNKQEWYNNKFGRAVNAMSGMNRTTKIDYDTNYSNFMAARAAGGISGTTTADPFGGQLNIISGLGTPAYIETENVVNKAFGKVESGMQDLENIIPGLKDSQLWINAKNNGDYNKLISIIKGGQQYKRMTLEERQNIDQKLRDLSDNASLITSIKKQGGNYQAIAFNGAFTTGGELPSNNPYTKSVMNAYNSVGGPNATQLRYSFEDNQELQEFINKVGIDINTIKKATTEDGLPAIILDKSDTRNYKAMAEYANAGYLRERTSVIKDIRQNGFWKGISRFRYRSINALDSNGAVLDGKWDAAPRELSNKRMFWANNVASEINNTFMRASQASKSTIGSVASNTLETTTKHMELPGVIIARDSGLKPGEEKSMVDNEVNKVINNIMGMNGSQYDIMLFDNDTMSLRKSNITDRTEALENVKAFITANRSSMQDLIGIRIIDGKVGYRIQIPKNLNKSKNTFTEGDIENGEIVIFDPNDAYLNSMANNSSFRAAAKYDRLSRIANASHTTYDNNTVSFDAKGNPYINGNLTNRMSAINLLDKDDAYNQIKDALASGNKNYTIPLAEFIRDYYGYEPGTPEFIEKGKDLVTQMTNELR